MKPTSTRKVRFRSNLDLAAPRCARCGCEHSVAPGRRKYCEDHGNHASRDWKRRSRRREANEYGRALGRDLVPTPPHLKGWPSREAYNKYKREGMRRLRDRRRAAVVIQAAEAPCVAA